MKVKLQNVRLSFPKLFKPVAFKDGAGKETGEPKYSAAFLLDKTANAQGIRDMEAAIAAVAKEKWADKVPKAMKPCLRDGVEKEETDGYGEEVMFFNASSAKKPVVVDRNRDDLQESDGRPYAGCYVNAVVRLWAQDNQFGKRVNASLLAVQFVRDGEAFGEAPVDADKEFDDIPEEADPLG